MMCLYSELDPSVFNCRVCSNSVKHGTCRPSAGGAIKHFEISVEWVVNVILLHL